MTYIKKYLHHLFVDGINGMAIGFFATFVFGSILQQISLYTTDFIRPILSSLGALFCSLTCAAIGIGVAHKFQEELWITLSAAICGMVGGYASEILAGTLFSGNSIFISSPGQPLGAFIAAYIGIEIGHLLAGKTKMDFLITPILTITSGTIAGLFLAPYISIFLSWFGKLITWGTQQNSLIMGVTVSILMTIASILPIQTITLASNLNLTGLAAGAATAGCCCSMIGFAIASYHENKVGGILAQGIGSSMLQLANIFRKPLIFLPILLASAIVGPISTVILQMSNTPHGAGLGNLAFCGPILAWQHMSQTQNSIIALIQVLLVYILLPGILTLFFSNWMREQKWIKSGDMKLDL